VWIELNEYVTLDIGVTVPKYVKVLNAEGLNVGRREADNEGCEVEVFDTDVEPVLVLVRKGVAD
jgi:hypothetical protein